MSCFSDTTWFTVPSSVLGDEVAGLTATAECHLWPVKKRYLAIGGHLRRSLVQIFGPGITSRNRQGKEQPCLRETYSQVREKTPIAHTKSANNPSILFTDPKIPGSGL